MYRRCDPDNGFPARLYRSADEIRRDILDISRRISECNDMMNVRNLISEIIISGSEGDIGRQLDAVTDLEEAAGEMISEMRQLLECVDMLSEELSECLRA